MAGDKDKQVAGTDKITSSERACSDAVTENDIRKRAYEIYLARAGRPGNAVLDWLQAERELREERGLMRDDLKN